MKKTILERMPADLRKNSIDLSELLGVNSHAWHFEDALNVAEWCRQNNTPIFGGDVIEKLSNGDLSFTYDNWYQNFDSSITLSEFVAKSVDYAIQKMTFYAQTHQSKKLLFDLVIKR